MRIKRTVAAFLGLMSVTPLAGLVAFLFMPHLSPALANSPGPSASWSLHRMTVIGGSGFIVVSLLIMALFVVFIWRSPRVPQRKKEAWTARVILGSLFTMPVFWFLYIWKDRPLEKRPTLDEYVSGAV